VDGDADPGRRGAFAGIGLLQRLYGQPELKAWRARARAVFPYLVGAAMFAVAIWVLRSTLRRYDLHDLHSELANLSLHQLGLAVLFTFCSFLALIGYEYSALGLVGKRMPLPHLALASFATQSIAHSTGFAFVIGASLRYHFYSDRGLGIGDVAMVQMFFTATFTLGVATLAGGVVLVEPMRLAMATGLPPLLWRLAAGTALSLVIGYVVWGGFFHRPLRWRGHEVVLPSAGATLVQIFFGVADLLAVAAALYVLLPAELHLGYVEVLAVFMAAIVIGLLSHVPGSLGVFESAIVLLLQPTDAQALPLIGSLLAFRGVYYMLPLACGVVVLAASEVHRWRAGLAIAIDRIRLDLGPAARRVAVAGVAVGGVGLLVLGQPHHGDHPAPGLAGDVVEAGRSASLACGVALLLLLRGLWMRFAATLRWALLLLLVAAVAAGIGGGSLTLAGYLLVLAALLFACRAEFAAVVPHADSWQAPVWAVLLAVTLASSYWLIGRG
jgi:uncharacterized membrane protein YbhN (UPF0104 family)